MASTAATVAVFEPLALMMRRGFEMKQLFLYGCVGLVTACLGIALTCWLTSRAADTITPLQTETATELDALVPSILGKAFKGEL